LHHRNPRSYVRRSVFEKREFFSAYLRPILWSEERLCRPLEELFFWSKLPCLGWRKANFLQGVLSTKIFAGTVQTYLSYIVLVTEWAQARAHTFTT
jgi:hypothetical protein